MVKPNDRVLIANLQPLQQVPGAEVQLMALQKAKQVLAIHEDGFLNPEDFTAGYSHSADDSTPAAAAATDFAEQLLRKLRFLPGTTSASDPTRLLVNISRRQWPQLLLSQQQQQQQQQGLGALSSSSSSASSATEGFNLPGFKLLYPEAVAAGLLKPAAAIRVPTGLQVPSDLVAAADAAVLSSLHSSSSSSSSSSNVHLQQKQAVDQLGAVLASDKARMKQLAAVFNTLGGSGKGLVYASGQNHAREVSVGLNLQGISSLCLHEGLTPEDQASVLWAFNNTPDRVLVASSSSIGVLAGANLALPLTCVIMGVPTLSPEVYAAAVAPGLLAGFSAHAGQGFVNSSSSDWAGDPANCLVVDCANQLAQPAAAAAAAAVAAAVSAAAVSVPPVASTAVSSSSSRRRRRRSSTAALQGITEVSPAAAAVAAGSGTAAAPVAGLQVMQQQQQQQSLGCIEVFGSSACELLPLPDHVAAAVAAAALPPSSSSSSTPAAASRSSSKGPAQPGVTGDLSWTICKDGSWAIPLKKGSGKQMNGLRVLWLGKVQRGFVPQLEEGLGHMVPLAGTTGKPIQLQRARVSHSVLP
jgi:hypothetical protein